MILSLHAQAQLFLLTVLLGGGMGLFYDGLRVFRHDCHYSRDSSKYIRCKSH